ncbi:MAG: chromate resistance protein [Omnitrophica bacterium]|nr:chromate resistance protein [Candidatus Omnitrophota bacterium]
MTPFINSFTIALGTALCSLVVGLPLAVFLVKTDIPFKRLLKYIYLIPIFIPPSIVAVTWINLHIFGKWIYSVWGSIFLLTLCYFPFVTLLSCAGLSAVGKDLEDAARLDYGELGVLRLVTIPYAFKHILAGALFVFVFAISNYEIPALLGVQTFLGEIFVQFSGFYNTKKAFLLSLPLIGITSFFIIIAVRALQDKEYFTISQDWAKPRLISLSPRGKIGLLSFSGVILGFSVLLPFFSLVYKAGGFITYRKAFLLSQKELSFSLLLAFGGAVVIVFTGFLAAYLIERSKSKIRHFLNYIFILPFAVPPTIWGIILIKVFNRPVFNFIYSTPLILLIGYWLRFVPFAVRILCANISHIDKSLEEEAQIEGAGFLRRLFCIVAPLCRKGFMVSLLIVFVLIMGELGLTILVVPAGSSTLILKVYTLMHYGAGKLVAGLSLVLLFAVLLLAGVMTVINKLAKKVFLVLLIGLFIWGVFFSSSFAEDRNKHLYSTWDVLEIDTCVSAWLIKRFIDKEGEFKFYPKGEFIGQGVAFDTPDAQFRRTQNMSTFETLVKEYRIKDSAVERIAKMMHEIEVNYWYQSGDKRIQKFKKGMLSIIDKCSDPDTCFQDTFSYLDKIYTEIRKR